MASKKASKTIKLVVLQALNEIGRSANVLDIYEHIVGSSLYRFNSPQAKKIVDQTIKIHTENTKRADVKKHDILFICADDFSSRNSLIGIHPRGAKLLEDHWLLFQKIGNSDEQLSKEIGTTSAELSTLSAPEKDAIIIARRAGIEGAVKLFMHFGRERDQSLSKEAKKAFLELHGKLTCEACGTEPMKTYGVEIIEAHHKVPLSTSNGPRESSLEDFLLLCPSCHRAVHMLPDCDYSMLIRKFKK